MGKENKIRIAKRNLKNNTCNILLIPKEVCGIIFDDRKKKSYSYSISSFKEGNKTIPFLTDRDEMFIIDFNKKNKIIRIELIDSKKTPKPCMK